MKEHVREHGLICPGYDRAPHPVERGELTGDHRVPRSLRPDLALDLTNVDVLCASCNSAKGAAYPGVGPLDHPAPEPLGSVARSVCASERLVYQGRKAA